MSSIRTQIITALRTRLLCILQGQPHPGGADVYSFTPAHIYRGRHFTDVELQTDAHYLTIYRGQAGNPSQSGTRRAATLHDIEIVVEGVYPLPNILDDPETDWDPQEIGEQCCADVHAAILDGDIRLDGLCESFEWAGPDELEAFIEDASGWYRCQFVARCSNRRGDITRNTA